MGGYLGLVGITMILSACWFSAPGGTQGAQASAQMVDLTVTATDLKFAPAVLRAALGQPIRVTFINKGAIEHDWEVEGLRATEVRIVVAPPGLSQRMRTEANEKSTQGVAHASAGAGQQMVISFTPTQSGTYEVFCTVPGHKQAGMVGQFVVGDGSPSTGGSPGQGSTSNASSPAYAPGGLAPAPAVSAPRLNQPRMVPASGVRPSQVVSVELETRELMGQMDDGVAYSYWTFDGTVPGPMLRVRQGDAVEVTLRNAADSQVAHSIDLHAVTGPGGGASVTQIAPGETASFRFQALNPGVFVYHCATPPVAQHLANGMYGLIVVEPPEGLPPVDREFYVMQGEFYAQGSRGEKGARAFSMEKMLDERPDYVVFNGSVGAIAGASALRARVGETVRIFFGVGGSNVTSSFHVIGEIFDRVAPEAGSSWSSNVQTTLVPAGGATIAEFRLEVPGDYVLVDHSLSRREGGGGASPRGRPRERGGL